METILAAKTRSKPSLEYRREILKMADGGCVALDWEYPEAHLVGGGAGGGGEGEVNNIPRHTITAKRK